MKKKSIIFILIFLSGLVTFVVLTPKKSYEFPLLYLKDDAKALNSWVRDIELTEEAKKACKFEDAWIEKYEGKIEYGLFGFGFYESPMDVYVVKLGGSMEWVSSGVDVFSFSPTSLILAKINNNEVGGACSGESLTSPVPHCQFHNFWDFPKHVELDCQGHIFKWSSSKPLD